VNDLETDIAFDAKTAILIRELHAAKEKAVGGERRVRLWLRFIDFGAEENYEEAKRLKSAIDYLKQVRSCLGPLPLVTRCDRPWSRQVGKEIADMELRKKEAVAKEDYDSAMEIKAPPPTHLELHATDGRGGDRPSSTTCGARSSSRSLRPARGRRRRPCRARARRRRCPRAAPRPRPARRCLPHRRPSTWRPTRACGIGMEEIREGLMGVAGNRRSAPSGPCASAQHRRPRQRCAALTALIV
jgi:hypothetical protein